MTKHSSPQIEAAIALIHAGLMTPTEAATFFGLSQSWLRRKAIATGFDPVNQRRRYLRRIASRAIRSKWKLPENWK